MAVQTEALPLEKALPEQIARFDVHQIIQHAGLMTSFILLVFTGLPLKYASLGISQWWAGIWGGVEVMRSVHYFAAYAMVAVCLYHAVYLLYTIAILKKPFPVKMIPAASDFTKFFHELAYFLGLTKTKPRFDRFNWKEKFDYWAIFWGVPIMAGSGFVLMFPVLITRIFPGWIVPAALIAHSDEAVLALTWIFMVHIFFNHFTPGIFPINTSIFTGKVPRERYRRDHPIEYERLTEAEEIVEGGQKEEN